jgi:hypothetical protein
VWTQRRAARPPVHRTISGWETFAQRNAALAALFLAESNLKRG